MDEFDRWHYGLKLHQALELVVPKSLKLSFGCWFHVFVLSSLGKIERRQKPGIPVPAVPAVPA